MEASVDLAGLDFPTEMVCCEVCDAPATLRIVFHTCNTDLTCVRHAEQYLGAVFAEMDQRGQVGVRCNNCGGVFLNRKAWVWTEQL